MRALLVLTGVGTVAAIALGAVIVGSPAHRMRAIAAVRSIPLRLQVAQAELERERQRNRPPPVLRCVPARTVGAPGTLLAVDSVPASSTATALFLWQRSGNASAEVRALRALRATDVKEFPGTPRALALTADGGVLRAARRAAPTASAQLAVSGTKELCFVAS
ncbi:hypothetical protein [Roseisolibacter agri]|uniref:hypothetical protein n=1 Tax=Roseisolibacter agri TaxID=2014610 RepID=UPI0024E11BB3|nr:hypothetical protein [Roseisolibacter agri]